MNTIVSDFVASGPPTYIRAMSGVKYLDILTGIRYKQTTIPYGQNWVVLETGQVFEPVSGTGAVPGTYTKVTVNGNGMITVGASATTADIPDGGTKLYVSPTEKATWNGKQDALVLTTLGSSGPATLVGATLNIPQYTGGGGGGAGVEMVLMLMGG